MDGANPDPLERLADAVAATRMVDLTHPLAPGIPVWPGHPRFCQEVVESLERGDASCFHALSLGEHTGTHFDAPSHFVRGGWAMAQAPIERFFGRAAAIGATNVEPGTALQAEAILAWEGRHGPIRHGDAVFFHFGWDRFWDTDQAAFLRDWPGLSGAAAELLVARGVRIAGSDCLSIDTFAGNGFAAHHALLGAGILIGENFANLGRLPPWCFLATLPLPIVNGSGSPLRAIAFLPET